MPDSTTIWHFAAGGKGRNYSDLLIEWDVIVLGPGRLGSWKDNRSAYDESGISSTKVGEIRRFYEEIDYGDLVVLRRKTSNVYAVGEVVGEAKCLEAFADVDGWDLQHTRRVRWLWTCNGGPKSFDTYTFEWGSTLHKGVKGEISEWIETLNLEANADRELQDLPQESGQEISTQDIGRHLFDAGVDANAINDLIEEIDELNRIARWYSRSAATPSEHETVAYLIIPLLRALGWTPQKMAVEWERMDLALFDRLPRTENHLIATVEAKKWGRSCLSARSQAERYATEVAEDTCRRLVVTDGNRYGVFVRDDDGNFPDRPDAYLNLADPKDAYPIMHSKGAQHALRLMSSDWTA